MIATDFSDYTLDIAQTYGADIVMNTRTEPNTLNAFHAEEGQIEGHLECSGAAAALATAVACLRPGGTLVQLGLGGDMNIPLQAITTKEITLRGSFRFHSEFANWVDLMKSGLIVVDPLITHSFRIAEAKTAFETAGDRSQAMKVQISV